MRWREEDRGREGAEIISRKVLTQTDSRGFEALFKVKLRQSEQKLALFQCPIHILNKYIYTDLRVTENLQVLS